LIATFADTLSFLIAFHSKQTRKALWRQLYVRIVLSMHILSLHSGWTLQVSVGCFWD